MFRRLVKRAPSDQIFFCPNHKTWQHRLESKAPLKSSPRVLKASRRTRHVRHVRHVSFTRVLSGSWMVLATSRLHNSECTMILNHTLYILYFIHVFDVRIVHHVTCVFYLIQSSLCLSFTLLKGKTSSLFCLRLFSVILRT